MSESSPAASRVLVIIPTYNESENIERIITRLNAAAPAVDVLVVDDGSPDGTGKIVDTMAESDPRVHALHRQAKLGFGAAYIAGFDWGLEHGYDVLVEMDADGSHPPERLPRMLEELEHADFVVGSRYVPGGSVVNWPWHREVLSKGGNLYARLALGLSLRDATGGFRAFRRRTLEGLDYATVESVGYCFQVDLAWRAFQAGFHATEVPITFTERERGESKMSGDIVREAFLRIGQWGVRHRTSQVRALLGRRR